MKTQLFSCFFPGIKCAFVVFCKFPPASVRQDIPTSKSVKFKVKGWADMFGQRAGKMGGAQVTNALKANMAILISYGALLSLGIVGVWIMVAFYVGNKNKKMLEEGIIIH